MSKTNIYKLTLCFFVTALLISGRAGIFSSGEATAIAEAEVVSAGGPDKSSVYELKHSLERVYREQSILHLTEQLIREQLESLSKQAGKDETQWSEDLLTRIYDGKKHLGTVLLRKQLTQHKLNQMYRMYLKAGGDPIPFLGDQELAEQFGKLGEHKMLSWPVEPKRGISAYFMDGRYRNFFGMNHYALDIPARQWTVIQAPADGIVKEVNNAGFGYSTLIISHGGFETLYGHVAEFLVQKGQKISQGDPIALSGGRRGSPGAGLVTTGAHLHFEVLVDGQRVDPLQYLPEHSKVRRRGRS